MIIFIIGAGMGGLSAANFLIKYDKSVLVQIATIIYSKAISNKVYNGYAYRWWVTDKSYYPI